MSIAPQTAIGYFVLSVGFVFAIRDERTRARILWAVPLAIALLSLFQNVSGLDLGTDRLLFPDAIQQYAFAHPGRAGASPTTIFLLLTGAAYFAKSRRWRRSEIASLVASGVLCIASATALLILFSTPEDPISEIYRISVPSAVIAVSLVAAFVLWQSSFRWVRLLGSKRTESQLLQILLPAVLVLPLAPSLLGIALEASGLLSPLGNNLVVLIANILLITLITYWAIRRVAHDQAALVESIDALSASETRLSAATSAAQLAVFEWDVTSGRLVWSPGTEERMGLAPGTMPDYQSWTALVEPDDLVIILKDLEAAMSRQAERFSFRYRFVKPNGHVRVVEGFSRVFYDDAGKLTRTVGVLLDITEQEERAAELRGREEQLRSILDAVPDAIVVIDGHGVIRRFSAAAETLWGYSREEVIGKDCKILAPEEDRGRNAAALTSYLASCELAGIGDIAPATGQAADGRRFPLDIRWGIARFDSDVLLTLFARDQTEHLAAEERLSELNAELAHVSRLSAMSELAADLAHEFNQPLTATANFLTTAQMLVARDQDVERIGELLGLARDQTLWAEEIIRRLRAFITHGEIEIRPESVEQTVREAVDLVLVGAGQFKIRVEYDFYAEAAWMLADRIQVQQVLVNLLRNSVDALRHSRGFPRRINLSSRKISATMIEIEVCDTGPGIPVSVLNRLFSRFTTTKSKQHGMGVGLSISKRIIEAHGGELKAENRPEGGASFRFTVLAAEQETQA